jgi:hypothetical protein
MIQESELYKEEEWHAEQLAQRCLSALDRNNMSGHYFSNRSEACDYILNVIPAGACVGFGDSVTLHQIGIIQELEGRNVNQLFNPFRKDGEYHFPPTLREMRKLGLEALATDYFLTGVNVLTLDGKIVNADGMGNRVAGILFGPRHVIAVAGINKIVTNLDEALARIKKVAAPMNMRRHYLKHGLTNPPPCALTGVCNDCRHPFRACCFTVVVDYQVRRRIEVVLIGEKLGL